MAKNIAVANVLSAEEEAAILASMLGDFNDGEILEAGSDQDLEEEMLAIAADIEKVEIQASQDDEEEALAIVAKIEKAEAIQALYAEGEVAAPVVAEGDKPKTDKVAESKKKKAKKVKAEGEEVAEEAKVERVRRQRGHESRTLLARLGAKASEFLILELEDAMLDAEALKVKQDEFCATVDALADKVGQKATMLFGYMAHGGKLNEVLQRTFAVLARDGEITTGAKGNLQLDLLTKYSSGTSASQANQMQMLLPALKVTTKGKGKMVANPDSVILMKMKAELGLQ